MNIKDRRRWNNILIFVCCAFIITFGLLNFKQKAKNLSEIYPVEELKSIVFSNNKYNYTFKLKQQNWQLTKPFKYPIITERLEKINSIQSADIYKHISNKNIDEFGFSNTNYLKLNQRVIFFGDKALNSEHRYIMIDDKVFLINDAYYSLLSAGPSYWLQRHILPESDVLLSSISINDKLYKEADLINIADAWYEVKTDKLLYPADEFINPSPDDVSITITFSNDDTLQYIVHKEVFLMNTTFNLAYELDVETVEKLLTP